LSDSGLIRERSVGRSRLLSANQTSRYTRPLTELVSLAFGPQFVVGEEFSALDAIAVAIYAIEEVIRAQFGPALRAFGGLRRRRNELEYPLHPTRAGECGGGSGNAQDGR
jgi:hypothetical protein